MFREVLVSAAFTRNVAKRKGRLFRKNRVGGAFVARIKSLTRRKSNLLTGIWCERLPQFHVFELVDGSRQFATKTF